MDDARAAADDHFFYDEKRSTWIVCGRQGRTHAFSDDGKRVTSFTLPAGGAEFRVRTHRWRPALIDEIGRLKRIIAR